MEKKKQSLSNQVRKHKRILYDLFVTIENIIIGNSSITTGFKDGSAIYKIISHSNQLCVLLTYEDKTLRRGFLRNNISSMELKEERRSFNITTDFSCLQSVIKMNEAITSPAKETYSQFPILSEKFQKKIYNGNFIGRYVPNNMYIDKKIDTSLDKTIPYSVCGSLKGKLGNGIKEISPQTEVVKPNKQTTSLYMKNINISNPKTIKQYSVTLASKPEINHRRIIYDLFATIENIIIGASTVKREVNDGIISFKINTIQHQPTVLILYELPSENENKNSILQVIDVKEKHLSENIPFLSKTHSFESHFANMNVTILGEEIMKQEKTGPINLVPAENVTNDLHKNRLGVKSFSEELVVISLEHQKVKSESKDSKLLYLQNQCKIKPEPSISEREKNLTNVINSHDKTENQTTENRNVKLNKRHMKIIHTGRDFYNNCSKTSRDLSKKVIHERKHKCDYCEKEFSQLYHKNRHERQHLWSKTFAELHDKVRHERVHTSEKPYKCEYSKKTFVQLSSKKSHERQNTGEKPYKCKFCEKTFVKSSEKTRHERQHTGEKSYKCDYCEKTFAYSSSKKSHERQHTREKPYKCKYCEKTFIRSSGKRRHERQHTGEKPFKCKVCQKLFADLGNKVRHERLHTGEKPYKCEYCEKTFAIVHHKITHERLHTGEKPYKCRYCEKPFSNTSERICHERRHTGDKPFKCKYCEKSFSDASNKNCHERVHTAEKPYKCDYCEKTFTRSYHKVCHERVHTGEKPYKCEYCEKTFVQLSSKKSHERQHTGERPYKCKYCDKTYVKSSHKKGHERQHTGKEP